jgi:hypothetical protein
VSAPAQDVLLQVLRDCLENEDIGPADNFFAMGGDSLLALDVIAAVRERGLRIGMRDMLTRASVAELALVAVAAAAAAESADGGPPSDSPPGDGPPGGEFDGLDEDTRAALPAGVVAAQPASVLQQGLIYLAETAEGPRPFTDFLGARVAAPLDEGALRAALGQLISRHRSLRSSFDLHSFTEPVQLVWAGAEPPLSVEHESGTDRARDRISVWRERILTEGIDWDQAPAFRCQAVSSPGSFWLSVAVHHAIVDGWSFARLFADLLTYYDAEVTGRPAGLPPVPERGHGEFVALERAATQSAAARRFWLAEADAPPLLPGRPRFLAAASPASQRFLPISADRWDRLRRAAGELRVPLKSLLFAAHGWALARWSERSEVVSGLVVNGRPEIAGADRLVGLFLNTVPVRLRTVTGSWAEMAAAALEAERRAAPHARYPVGQLEEALGRPPFDVSFNYTHFRALDDLGRLAAVRVTDWWAFDKATTPMLVHIAVDAGESGTGLGVAFDPAYVPAARAQEFMALMDEAFRDAGAGR